MRKNRNKMTSVLAAAMVTAVIISGCQNQTSAPTAEGTTIAKTAAETITDINKEDIEVTTELGEGGRKTVTYLAGDSNWQWQEETAIAIELTDTGITAGEGVDVSERTATIHTAGTYVVSGTLTDGQILIDAGEGDVVQLVLNGVELSNTTTAPIYSSGKAKLILTLADETENAISDSAQYVYANATDDEPDAPIFANGDLTVNGGGSLTVTGSYACAIRSKDVLTVASGTLNIQAASDGLKGRDGVVIRDGQINITSGKDGIKANNDEDPELGYIWIDGGQITIAADDDGIQAESQLIILNGQIDITQSQEALAGRTVDISGGTIHAVASDDGINSAATVATEQEKMMDQDGVYTRIAGGELWLNAGADGIDSNGDLYLDGGTLYLSGPSGGGNGIIDYNGSGYLTGGVIFAAGTSAMMQTFDESSIQNYLVVYYPETQMAGTPISVTGSDGNETASFAPENDYNAVIISMPQFETGTSWQVVTGGEGVELQIQGLMTVSGTAAAGAGGGPGGFGGGQRPGGNQPAGDGSRRGGNRSPEDGQQPESTPDSSGSAVGEVTTTALEKTETELSTGN